MDNPGDTPPPPPSSNPPSSRPPSPNAPSPSSTSPSPPPPPAPIQVRGQLTVTRGPHRLDIRATGRKIVIEAADFDTLQMLLEQRPAPKSDGEGQLKTTLDRLGLDLEIHCDGDLIARIGTDAEPGWLEKMLKIKDVDISARGLIKSWFKS